MTAAARSIPDLAAVIFSAYCSGIRVDFHPPACVGKSTERGCARRNDNGRPIMRVRRKALRGPEYRVTVCPVPGAAFDD
jgi:hypothetical protein